MGFAILPLFGFSEGELLKLDEFILSLYNDESQDMRWFLIVSLTFIRSWEERELTISCVLPLPLSWLCNGKLRASLQWPRILSWVILFILFHLFSIPEEIFAACTKLLLAEDGFFPLWYTSFALCFFLFMAEEGFLILDSGVLKFLSLPFSFVDYTMCHNEILMNIRYIFMKVLPNSFGHLWKLGSRHSLTWMLDYFESHNFGCR